MQPTLPYRIVSADFSHIPALAARLRQEDRREAMLSHGFGAREALEFSLSRSALAWTCLLGDEPQIMWGAAPLADKKPGAGSPWLLSSPALYRLQRPFLRHCPEYMELVLRMFPRLENYVHAENHASIRWLRWCGFELALRPEPYGVAGEPFYYFWRN